MHLTDAFIQSDLFRQYIFCQYVCSLGCTYSSQYGVDVILCTLENVSELMIHNRIFYET